MIAMFFTSAVVCAVLLLGTDPAQGTPTCEACKAAVDALRNLGTDVTEDSCREAVNVEDEDTCESLAEAASEISSRIKTSRAICQDHGFCSDPPPATRTRFIHPRPDVVEAAAVAVVVAGVVKLLIDVQPILIPLLTGLAMAGRKKRDISSIDMTEGKLPEFYDEEEYDQFRNMDATLDPVHGLSGSLDTDMNEVEMKLMCDVCQLRKSLESSNTELVDGEGTSEGMVLCRSLPKKKDQRKCIMDLRQIRETIGSIFGPVESCQFLSCVSE